MNAPRIRPSQRLPLCGFVYFCGICFKADIIYHALFLNNNHSTPAKVIDKLLQRLHQLMR